MRNVTLPPRAALLLESMRAVGYDPAAAVADIVDNSVTARARRVMIRFDPGPVKAVGILDDGLGMSSDELHDAMRHGSRSPSEVRAGDDLGRYGLGLKTASLSQCRRLTVATRREGRTLAVVWDLDTVAATDDWTLGVLDPDEVHALPFVQELDALPSGTLVLWEKLDHLGAHDPGDGSILSDRMRVVADHLALVFHRFLEAKDGLRIEVNGAPLEPIDPFLEKAGAQAGPEEPIELEGHRITLKAYTLPHISRLHRAQIERAGGDQGLRRQQGFYVYRNRRLIIWGTWFRLVRQEELTKLTRVRVDVPNALDHLWSLDIKKSAASPPAAIRERLRGLVPTMTRASRSANEYRGRVAREGGIVPLWNRIEDRDGIRYEVNASHPVVHAFRKALPDGLGGEFTNLLQAAAESFPVEALYNDRAGDRLGHKPDEADETLQERLEDLARQMLAAFDDLPMERQALLEKLHLIEPFVRHPALTTRLKKRLS